MTFGGVTDGNLVYMTKQVVTGDGQDFWLLAVNPADGSIRINRFFNAPGGFGMMVAGNRLLVPTEDIPTTGPITPELLGLDLSTGATMWAHAESTLELPSTTDGNRVWINQCGNIVKLDAENGTQLESVAAPADVYCQDRVELAGDLLWFIGGDSSNALVAVRSDDLSKVASVPLPPDDRTNFISWAVIAGGHVLVVQQQGTTSWKLESWGI